MTWTLVPKPTGDTTVNIFAGEPIGLLLALTYADDSSFGTVEWTNVAKPTGTPWTNVAKPTT